MAVPGDSVEGPLGATGGEERVSWELQRQKREKLSNLMGQYLLKGYRMLGSTCSNCGNILLQTRQGSNYCVQCEEINQKAKKAVAGGSQQQQTAHTTDIPDVQQSVQNSPHQSTVTHQTPVDNQIQVPATESVASGLSPLACEVCTGLEKKLVSKLEWASGQLSMAGLSVEESTRLCLLVKACAEALKSVRDLDSSEWCRT